jgi:hypothetical protein
METSAGSEITAHQRKAGADPIQPEADRFQDGSRFTDIGGAPNSGVIPGLTRDPEPQATPLVTLVPAFVGMTFDQSAPA